MSSTSPDLAGKRLELLQELRPGLRRVAFLGAANDPNTRTFVNETQAAADSIRVRLQPLLVTGPEEFEAAFAAMIKQGSEGLIVPTAFRRVPGKLAELAARHRLPMIADQTVFARAGGLVAYGALAAKAATRTRIAGPGSTSGEFLRARSPATCRSIRPPGSNS